MVLICSRKEWQTDSKGPGMETRSLHTLIRLRLHWRQPSLVLLCDLRVAIVQSIHAVFRGHEQHTIREPCARIQLHNRRRGTKGRREPPAYYGNDCENPVSNVEKEVLDWHRRHEI